MEKVESFKLTPGTRIGNYRVLENRGGGSEGEVYKVAEVPTGAIRALKLFRTKDLTSRRHLAHRHLVHFAWYYEELQCSGSVPIYHHYGQWSFDDDGGCWFLVFEFIEGIRLDKSEHSEELFLRVAKSMARVHEIGYGVGDLGTLTNVIVRKVDGEPIFVDCEPGEPDSPNEDFAEDCNVELPEIAKRMFGKSLPAKVEQLLSRLKKSDGITQTTLSKLLHEEG